MKLYKTIIRVFLAGLVFILACSEDRMDSIGTNPNNPTEVPIKLLIPQVTLTTAFETLGTDLAWYSSVFCEHTVGVHGQLEVADKRTAINSTIGNNNWNSIYATTLKDLSIIIEQGSENGREEGYWLGVGIAKVLFAINLGVATDLWGEVPYSDALQGRENRTAVFDSQEDVYTSIMSLLDDAITDLGKESTLNPGAADYYYQGDADQWIKAAYALKARFSNRLSNINAIGSADDALSALTDAFTSSDDDMIFDSFTTDATGENPWFQEVNDRSHHAVSQTLFDILNALNDPRIDIWFGTVEGQISPAPPGVAITDQGGTIYSRASATYLTAQSSIPVITYDELKFIEAEAYFRKDMRVEAHDAYLEAIELALVRNDIDSDDITTYLNQPNVNVGADNLTLEDIIKQKYISFWLFQPIEAYNDYRRTGLPAMQNPVAPPPERFPYPNDEVAANPNVPDISYTQKVWWARD